MGLAYYVLWGFHSQVSRLIVGMVKSVRSMWVFWDEEESSQRDVVKVQLQKRSSEMGQNVY